MFFVEGQIRVMLHGEPCDMRKSYDGLQALARHAMGRDPLDGALYVFINRRGTQLKCLYCTNPAAPPELRSRVESSIVASPTRRCRVEDLGHDAA